MDDLIRVRIQEALAVQPPLGLRARVIAAVPLDSRRSIRSRPRSTWWGHRATGFAAVLLTMALIVGLLYTRTHQGLDNPGNNGPGSSTVRLVSPEGIAVAPDGTVYVSDYLGERVFKLSPDGSLVAVAGGGLAGDGPALKASLFHPAGLAVDTSGNLYIADNLGGTVRRVDRQGNITTIVRTSTPLGLAFDSGGGLFVSGYYGDLQRIDIGGTSAAVDVSSVPPPVVAPAYLATDAAGDLYIGDRAPAGPGWDLNANPIGGCRIVRVNTDRSVSVVAGTGVCGFSGDGGPATSAQLNDPNGIVFDSAGNMYVGDASNHRIRRIDKNGVITTVAGTGTVGHAGDGGPAIRAQLAFPFGMGLASGNLLYFSDSSCACTNPLVPGRVRVMNLADGKITTVAGGYSRVVIPT